MKNFLNSCFFINKINNNFLSIHTILTSIKFCLTKKVNGIRLDKALSLILTQYSRNCIQKWIKLKQVLINNKIAETDVIVSGNELITIKPKKNFLENEIEKKIIKLDIIYEDNEIIIINKSAGLVVHPAIGHLSGTLFDHLLRIYPFLINVPRAGIVHRLDKNSSGLMVVAKSIKSYTHLVNQLKLRIVQRKYLAMVWGIPKLNGVINAAIIRNPHNRIKMIVSKNFNAKPALTYYERLAIGIINRKHVSLVRCNLKTGRTHQIRVHMQWLGHGIIGDNLYNKKCSKSLIFNRQALHAYKLGLIHPENNLKLKWKINLPDDISKLVIYSGIKWI
ncbi:RluA family pseudouridine synthase [Candidatus Profftella armatura (Diaphorina cf. continua)]|uniref:Pseudouridine synthase n=1 Tax=Candidatus Profftella armatura (Diaphorina cf. continua) TaxID=2661583 RepID=A0A7R7AB31_9PROT|nr:RluA family pseudouridine synthase [Candidatus Profftella armatura (Diaphorina cf. continua)]BCG49685.1 RluA family pseudouridine synthase [Candidatus Profftella armatura (Diaphorina cf. continua)]